MLWDKGFYEPLENPKSTYKKGYLKFILNGTRLKGAWTLINFKENNWLLIKEKDNIKLFNNINEFNTSIKTGRTMEEITLNKKKINYKDNLKNIKITNPDKIMYKKNKITKQDIINYYQKVYPFMERYLNNRLISTVRCPDGTDGDAFFKKHFEENKYLKKKIVTNKGKKETYYYIDSLEAFIYEAQMNSIEFHIWGSKATDINNPDYLVFDLDPDEALSIDKVQEGVKDLKAILDKLKLKSYLKTSGGKGYHVVVPIKEKISWHKFRKIAKTIAKLMESNYPDKYTSNMRKDLRKNKIFIDWVRNVKGATSVAPYSLRARKAPTVSMPIKWSELDKIKPDEIDINAALKRLSRTNPWHDFWD